MWWFLKGRQRQSDQAGIIGYGRLEATHLLTLTPDLSARLEPADVAIKIWLPEMVACTVKYVADYEGISQSAWLREVLIAYVYGRVASLAQRIRRERSTTTAAADAEVPLFSRKPVDRTTGRWVYLVPQLGKNTVAFKLWVSAQMRDDLLVLAEHANVALSAFVREAIVADLLGRGSLPERPAIIGEPGPTAEAWERGEDVPSAAVEEAAHHGLGEAQRIWREG